MPSFSLSGDSEISSAPPGVQQGLPFALQVVLSLLTPLLAIPAAYYCWKLFAVIRRRLLWKIRRRLILAHIFIGAIPVLLILLIVWVSALLFYYQLSYYLISNQIGIHTAQVHAFNVALRTALLQASGSPLDPAELKTILDRDSKYLLASYPSASIILRYQDAAERANVIGGGAVKPDLLSTYQVPRWTDRDFYGLVLEDAQPELYKDGGSPAASSGAAKRLFIRSFVISDYRSEFQFSIEASVPFDRHMLDRLKASLGVDLLLAKGVGVSTLNVMLQNTDILKNNIESATFELEDNQGLLRGRSGPSCCFPWPGVRVWRPAAANPTCCSSSFRPRNSFKTFFTRKATSARRYSACCRS